MWQPTWGFMVMAGYIPADSGCHNINLVPPTHVVPQILEALEVAVSLGLKLPLVYNSGGYGSMETLKMVY